MDISPLIISLKVSAISTAAVFFAGVIAAWRVTLMQKGRVFFDALFSLPMVLPPTFIGFLLLVLFGKNSFLGSLLYHFGISIVFTQKGAIAAAFAVSFPIMYTTARGAFEQADKIYTDAAKALGMSSPDIFTRVTLPIAWQGIVPGIIMTFARSMGEFGATIMIAGNIPGRTQNMSVALYTAMQSGNRELASKWAAVMLCISFISIALVKKWDERLRSRNRKNN